MLPKFAVALELTMKVTVTVATGATVNEALFPAAGSTAVELPEVTWAFVTNALADKVFVTILNR